MYEFKYPPWEFVANNEVETSYSSEFNNCEAVIREFASKGGGIISERRYSVSKKWGKILRAKVGFTRANMAVTSLVTCWAGAGPEVQIAVEVEGCGPQR